MNHPSSGPSTSFARGFPLRLTRDGEAAAPATTHADHHGRSADADTPRSMPAGSGAGVADPSNPLRIDAFTAIAATLDPETRALFEEAVRTLHELREGREHVEAKLRETGREDAIRTVTGTSAIDIAIERTESMLRQLGSMRRHDDVARL
jgi:hypothetical protein